MRIANAFFLSSTGSKPLVASCGSGTYVISATVLGGSFLKRGTPPKRFYDHGAFASQGMD
jgi:hypothetical protein